METLKSLIVFSLVLICIQLKRRAEDNIMYKYGENDNQAVASMGPGNFSGIDFSASVNLYSNQRIETETSSHLGCDVPDSDDEEKDVAIDHFVLTASRDNTMQMNHRCPVCLSLRD